LEAGANTVLAAAITSARPTKRVGSVGNPAIASTVQAESGFPIGGAGDSSTAAARGLYIRATNSASRTAIKTQAKIPNMITAVVDTGASNGWLKTADSPTWAAPHNLTCQIEPQVKVVHPHEQRAANDIHQKRYLVDPVI
jgi:hypothetical protein